MNTVASADGTPTEKCVAHIVGRSSGREVTLLDFPNFYVFVSIPRMNLVPYNFCPLCGVDLRLEGKKSMPHIEVVTAEELAKYPTGK